MFASSPFTRGPGIHAAFRRTEEDTGVGVTGGMTLTCPVQLRRGALVRTVDQ